MRRNPGLFLILITLAAILAGIFVYSGKFFSSDGPITLPYNTVATITWTSKNAASCTTPQGFTGTSGSFSTGNLVASKVYTLDCVGPGGIANDYVKVNVLNQDGSRASSTNETPYVKLGNPDTAKNNVVADIKVIGPEWMPWRLGLDLVGGSHLVYEADLSQVAEKDRSSVANGLRDVIERRVNLFGVSEPQVFTAQAGNRAELIVELAGVKEISEAIRQIGETPMLDFRLTEINGSSTTFTPTNLTGRYVSGAQLEFDRTTQAPQVSISFNSEGAGIFERMTGENVGKPIGIFLDGNLIEAPVVQQKISGGQAVITGRFTIEQARKLVERFNAGALPAPITLINQQTISPSLGADSLRKVILAGIIGTLLVMIFMVMYYRLLGFFAVLSLLIYVVLTLGVFKLIPITLSLAGLAGFILTIGMAVDANVLIFERIKEETKRGLSKSAATEEGFRRAWPSIRDSNTSTIITAFILYFFTSSFVRGFALTLLFGVAISLFSAITTTRLFLRVFVKSSK